MASAWPAAGAGTSTVEWGWGGVRGRSGVLIVLFTDTIRLAASEAAVRALIHTVAGSHTNAWKLLAISSLLMSTPYHTPHYACGRAVCDLNL